MLRLTYTHAAGVSLQSARLASQRSIRSVQLSKSCCTFGNDAASGVVISSGGGGGISGGRTIAGGEGGIEAAQAVSSSSVSSSAAVFFGVVVIGYLSCFFGQRLFGGACLSLGCQRVGDSAGYVGVPTQFHLVAAAGVGPPVRAGQRDSYGDDSTDTPPGDQSQQRAHHDRPWV